MPIQQLSNSQGIVPGYQIHGLTGNIAAGAGALSEIGQFRWTSTASRAYIQSVRLDSFRSLGTGFAAGLFNFNLHVARSWSADGTGGTAQTVTGNNAKLRVNAASTAVGTIRVATTAALGAGTKTFDANPARGIYGVVDNVVNKQFVPPTGVAGGGEGPFLYNAQQHLDLPIVLDSNEGFAIRATVPGTGVWEAAFTIIWVEQAR